jgi:hypothetical protein
MMLRSSQEASRKKNGVQVSKLAGAHQLQVKSGEGYAYKYSQLPKRL